MFSTKQTAALVSIATLLAVTTVHAQTSSPTQADFDRCNRVAQAAVGGGTNPSASPSTGSSSTGSMSSPSGSSSSTATPSGSSSSGSVASSPSGSGTSGSTYGTGSTSSGAGTSGSSSATSPSGGMSSSTSSSSDPMLRGMASAGMNNPAYQRAYRDCMAGK